MSSQGRLPLDEEGVRHARRTFQALVEDIRELSEQDIDARQFFDGFLRRITGILGSVAGAAWLVEGDGHLALQAEVNLAEANGKPIDGLLAHVLTTGNSALAPPNSTSDGVTNPTDLLLVIAPLKDRQSVVGVTALFQTPDRPAQIQQGYLSLLQQLCVIGEDFLRNRRLGQFDESQRLWGQFEHFCASIQSTLRRTETAYTIANEGCRLIGCDRVSVVVKQYRKCRVEAVSGQDAFDPRSNLVRTLRRLATIGVGVGEPLWYTGNKADMPPQVEEALDAFLDESPAKLVAVLPLRNQAKQDDNKKPEQRLIIGAIVLEQFHESNASAGVRSRAELVGKFSALALANVLEHEGLIFAPLSRAIRKVGVLGKRPWVRIAAGLVLAVILTLVFVPADFELEGRGTLEPVGRYDVFSQAEGVVSNVLVRHGDLVKADDVVVEMRNVDVEVKLAELNGQSASTTERLAAVRTSLLGSRLLTQSELNRLHGEEKQLEETLNGLKHQLELYSKKLDQFKVRTPASGQVVTWDVYDLLIHRPVKTGERLLTVADRDGPWELHVRMPEDRMGHIVTAQGQFGEALPVTFMLATEPRVTYQGTLKEVHQRAEVRGEEGNTVLIKVEIDKNELSQLRRGATVIAKVHCGRRSVGYVWFHDLFEFVQSRILFRFWR